MGAPRATIGILALQGAIGPHRKMLERGVGAAVQLVRSVDELARVDGLVLPGGESTTIGKLLQRHRLDVALRARAAEGMPIFGTCAGMILLARDVLGSDQMRLGLLDIAVERNAFGRQVDSFEADIAVPELGKPPVSGVFIRAPAVESAGEGVQILGRYRGRVVAVRQGAVLATAFHPELTEDTRFHAWFTRMVTEARPRER
ncbi:MAG: pyridoxal 5'-phosphate synthase glutaminase subunit PdxT [Chthonomonadales bacterium]|nr:pyridoxal 5'-phosphate synthase glutaminase subunit PdxT [Chthonomonadales bacterium]